MLISRIFKFDAAHKLENYPGKCSQIHGHTWKLVVSCSGEVNQKTGMIIDFLEIKRIVEEKVLNKLDHSCLNDVIKNPTCENILLWIKEQLAGEKNLKPKKLALYENEDSFCEMEC